MPLTIRRNARFATTHWSVVQAAGGSISTDADAALSRLCESYWYPLYAYLRSHGHKAEDAQDLTQAFFAHLVEKRAILRADPARGRFRSFLLGSLKNFVVNEWERSTAQKRGGLVVRVSIDDAEGRFQHEAATEDTPDRIFDRTWALTLLDRAIERLRNDLIQSGKGIDYVERFLVHLMGDRPQPGYADTATALGMSEDAVKVAVHRMRRKFRDLVLEEIAHTVASPDEIDDEARYLLKAVGR